MTIRTGHIIFSQSAVKQPTRIQTTAKAYPGMVISSMQLANDVRVFSKRRVHTLSIVAFPAKGLYQRRDEVLDGLAASSHDKQEAEAPSSPVLDGHLQSRPLADSFLRALGETHAVDCKSITGQNALFLAEELAVHGRWIVRHDKHDNYAEDTGCHALDDLGG